MCDLNASKYRPEFRVRVAHLLLAAGAVVIVSLPSNALAQSQTACGPEVKEAVAAALANVEPPPTPPCWRRRRPGRQYQSCGTKDATLVPPTFIAAARECGAAVSNLGSLFYEEMPCAGYDPQRQQSAARSKSSRCSASVRRPCRAARHACSTASPSAGVLLPVGADSVHLADAIANQSSHVAVRGDRQRHHQPATAATHERSNARGPIDPVLEPQADGLATTRRFGNALNYRIRLDQ